jgi:hypothetical protein
MKHRLNISSSMISIALTERSNLYITLMPLYFTLIFYHFIFLIQ